MNHKKSRSLFALIVLSSIVLLSLQQPVNAQTAPPGLVIQAQAAYEGNFKYGEWLPIWVTLENSGGDIDAVLQAKITQAGGTATYARRVSLPHSSRKQVILYVLPNNFSREIEIQLASEDTLLSSHIVEVSPIQTDHYLIGIASPERGPLSLISSLQFEQSPREIVLTNLDINKLPDQPASLNSFDVIILNDTDTSALGEGQQQTLESWVKNGGFLVIGGGPGIEKTASGLPDSLVLFDFQEIIESSDLQSLEQLGGGKEILLDGPFIISRVNNRVTGSTRDDLPILQQWKLGKGTISLISLSLTDAPFNAWSGTPEFWKSLLEDDAFFPNWLPRDMSDRQMRLNSMAYPLSSLPVLDLPSIRGLGGLLIAYIILIGPVNYWVLKRKKKFFLAWATIPLLTIVFAVGAFGLAYAMRGKDIVTNKLAIINLDQEGYAHVNSYIGMFSPAQESYEVTVAGDLLLSPATTGYYDPWSSYYPGSAVGETIFLQGNPSKVIGLEINQWSMQSFNSENLTAYYGPIDSDLILSGDQLTGSIHNRMDIVLKNAVIVFGNSLIELGDIDPGESTVIESTISEHPTEFYSGTLSYKILENFYPDANFGFQREFELRRSFLDAAFQPFGFWIGPTFEANSSDQENMLSLSSVYLLGWVEDAPPDIQVDDKPASQNTLGLLTTHLPLRLAKGDYSFPTMLIEGRVSNQSLNNGYCGGASTSVYMEYGTAEFEFQIPPVLLETKIEQLLVKFEDEASQWAGVETGVSLAIFNWQKERWVGISSLSSNGISSISESDSFIDPNGIIRVKLEREAQNTGGCVLVLVGLEGSAP